MPTDEYGKEFSQLRDLYKECESLGVVGIVVQEPVTTQTVEEALRGIVQNTRQLVFELEALTKFK